MTARTAAESIVRFVSHRWWVVLIGVALALGVAALGYGRAIEWDPKNQPVDNRLEIWFMEDDPALVGYRDFTGTFGSDEVVLLLVRDERGIFRSETLNLVAEVSSRVAALPKIDGVTSLYTVLHTGGSELAIEVDRMYSAPVKSQAEVDQVRARILANELYRKEIISPDEKSTLLSIRMGVMEDIDMERGAVLASIREILAQTLEAGGYTRKERTDTGWAWAGFGVGNEALNKATQSDFKTFTNLSLLVILVCLWFSLRRVASVAMAMVGVIVAVQLLLGVYLGLGYKINMVTTILPSLVMVIGLTDSVYFITTYYQERAENEAQGLSKREAIVKSFGFCFLPGFFNSITASVGFLAFATAKMAVIRWLGIFAGIGIMLAFITSVVFCTVGCTVFDVRPPERKKDGPVDGLATRALAWLSEFVVLHNVKILVASALLFLVGLYGITRINVDSDPVNYFYADHPVRKDSSFIIDHFGPALPLEFLVETHQQDGMKRLDVLRAIEQLSAKVSAREAKIGHAVSLVDAVKNLHKLVVGTSELPETDAGVEQLLFFFDPDNNDDPLRLVDFPNYETGRISFRTEALSSRDLERIITGVERDAKELFPAGVTVRAAGGPPLYVKLIDYIVDGQISSITTTFLVIFFIIMILFRSLRYALISIPPNVLPVAMTLGVMGYAGINLDGATVLIASIALGVAVDDTIHFIFKFKAVYEETGDDLIAVQKTLRTTGVAIATTSIVIALGFSVIALANLKSLAYFGILTAATMLFALIGELLVTPAVILTFGPRRAAPAPDDPPAEVQAEERDPS